MIFVTVGGQMPFPRLIHAMDTWAEHNHRDDVLAQIGETRERPRFVKAETFLTPLDFREAVSSAEVIVAHAGMGTILTAMEYQKPIVVMPRLARLGEHRNDHQVDTAKHLADAISISVAHSDDDLFRALDGLNSLEPPRNTGSDRDALCNFLADFIAGSAR